MVTAVGGNWVQAVPMEDGEENVFPHRRNDTYDSRTSALQEGPSHGPRRKISDYDIRSDTEGVSNRRTSVRTGHAVAARKRSKNTLRDKKKEKLETEAMDNSAWIHRDKLAQIEIREMREAGIIPLPRQHSHSAEEEAEQSIEPTVEPILESAFEPSVESIPEPAAEPIVEPSAEGGAEPATARKASSSARTPPHRRKRRPTNTVQQQQQQQQQEPEDYEPFDESLYDEFGRPKRTAAVPTAEGVQSEQQSPEVPVGRVLRTPPPESSPPYQNHTVRRSTSKIPISKSSPAPITSPDGPGSRNGANSEGGVLNNNSDTASRAQSQDAEGHADLDTTGEQQGQEDTASSRPDSGKARNMEKKSKPRVASGASSKRPGSSGAKSHFHAPEGDPPWLVNLYKPDPRLPPEEQILPTHAKRMMQEQWEREGKTGTLYDREFGLLNDEAPKLPMSSLPPALDMSSLQNDSSLLLLSPGTQLGSPRIPSPTPASPTKSDTGSPRPGTSGGYRITPTITTPPPMPRSPNNLASSLLENQSTTLRLPEVDEKHEAQPKKGCCCVVM